LPPPPSRSMNETSAWYVLLASALFAGIGYLNKFVHDCPPALKPSKSPGIVKVGGGKTNGREERQIGAGCALLVQVHARTDKTMSAKYG
jgi:hypothetical protein